MDERWTRRLLTIFLIALAVWAVTGIALNFDVREDWPFRLNRVGFYVGSGMLFALLAQMLVTAISYFRRQG